MPVGRPTDYSDKVLEKARDYLVTFSDDDNAVIPSVAGLALRLGVARSTVYKWAGEDDKKPFSDILADILSKQEQLLLNGGLRGDMNAAIAKLALGKHGYSDKVDNTHAGGDKPLETISRIRLVGVRPDPAE